MTISELKDELEQRGYFTRYLDEQLVVGYPPVPEAAFEGISTFRFCCAVTAHANGFELEYELAAYSKYTVVPDTAQVLEFITAKFPLP